MHNFTLAARYGRSMPTCNTSNGESEQGHLGQVIMAELSKYIACMKAAADKLFSL